MKSFARVQESGQSQKKSFNNCTKLKIGAKETVSRYIAGVQLRNALLGVNVLA